MPFREARPRAPRGSRIDLELDRQRQHHDRASLLAGRLHAILQRPYPKGRDFYDLIWYLGDRAWPPPNLVLLNDALAQTGWKRAPLSKTSWVAAVRGRLRPVRWAALAADVRPLLEAPEDRALLTRETLDQLLDERTIAARDTPW